MKIEKINSLFMEWRSWNFIFRPTSSSNYTFIGNYSFELSAKFIVHIKILDKSI